MTQTAPQLPPTTQILVVEDDLDTREFYEVLLADEGYHVLAASTGQQALAHVAVQPVNAIVLDRRLPDFDGVDLCRLLRQRVGTSVPIIFVTADRDPALEATARTAGITDFLLKPFHPADLLDRVRRFT
jgi:DNA-binding response OmpR family regulator